MSNKPIKLIGIAFIVGGMFKIIYVLNKYFNDQASNYVLFYFLLINSILQTVEINIGSIAYLYSVLFTTLIYIDTEFSFHFTMQIGGVLSVGYFPNREYMMEIGINVLPIFFTGIILKYINKSLSNTANKIFPSNSENK